MTQKILGKTVSGKQPLLLGRNSTGLTSRQDFHKECKAWMRMVYRCPSSIVTTYDDVCMWHSVHVKLSCVNIESKYSEWCRRSWSRQNSKHPTGDELRLQIMVFFVESIFFALLRKCQTAAGCFCWIHTLDLTCGLWESGLSLAKLPHTAAYDLGATGILVGSQCIGCIWRTVQAMEKGAVPVFFFKLAFQWYSDTELALSKALHIWHE